MGSRWQATLRRGLRLAAVVLALGLPLRADTQAATSSEPSEQPIDLVHVASVVGPAQGPRLTAGALEAEAQRVGALLRCPVCQGLSVADSPSTMATNMRQQVRDMVAAGFVEEQVLAYFEASYGEFVRLQPPLRGVNWLVWLAPLLGLLAGGAIVFFVLRGPRGGAQTPVGPGPVGSQGSVTAPVSHTAAPDTAVEADALPDDAELARLVLRIREIAYGWPGGVRPRAKEQA